MIKELHSRAVNIFNNNTFTCKLTIIHFNIIAKFITLEFPYLLLDFSMTMLNSQPCKNEKKISFFITFIAS